MIKSLRIFSVLALTSLLACGPALVGNAGSTEATDVVTRFYSTYQTIGHGGLPEPADQARLDPLLTPRLRGLLAAARLVQADQERRFPDEKPPFVDGDLFSSLFEGFKTFRVGTVEKLPGGAFRVTVDFSYHDAADPTTVTRWQDAVLVVRHEDALLIDDFELLGDWPFAQQGRLSEILAAAPGD